MKLHISPWNCLLQKLFHLLVYFLTSYNFAAFLAVFFCLPNYYLSQRSKMKEVADGGAGANIVYFCNLLGILKLVWYPKSRSLGITLHVLKKFRSNYFLFYFVALCHVGWLFLHILHNVFLMALVGAGSVTKNRCQI